MKLLIAMTMMVFTSTSVFAACKAESAGDCKLQVDCEKLNVGGKKVVEWKVIPPQAGQCVSLKAEDPNTDCSSINQKKGNKEQQPEDSSTGSSKQVFNK